eukprot:gene32577-41896_t
MTRLFSEQIHEFTHFGTIFLDLYESRATLQRQAPRTIQLNRAKYLEAHHWPKNAHVYVIPYPPVKLHPDFDHVLIQLLLRDKMAVVVLAEIGRPSIALQQLFVARLRTKISSTATSSPLARLVFPEIHSPLEMTALIQMADVVLEPFPMTGSFEVALSALSMGVPVVTMPHAQHIAGRLCLALYEMLDYGISSTPPPSQSSSPSSPSSPSDEPAVTTPSAPTNNETLHNATTTTTATTKTARLLVIRDVLVVHFPLVDGLVPLSILYGHPRLLQSLDELFCFVLIHRDTATHVVPSGFGGRTDIASFRRGNAHLMDN